MNVDTIVRIVREVATAHGGTVDTKELKRRLLAEFPPTPPAADPRQVDWLKQEGSAS